MSFQDFKYMVVQTFKEWSEDKASRLAAALSYYTVFSIPPLLIIMIAIAGQVFEDAEARVTSEITGFIGETGGEAIAAILENASKPGDTILATIISVGVLLLGASGVFGQLQDAMNTIWEVAPKPGRGIMGTIKDRFFSFTMVLGVGFLLLVSLLISTALSTVNEFIAGVTPGLLVVGQILSFAISFVVITLLFALMYKVIPDVQISWRDVWIGALVTALLFTIGKWGISQYLSRSAPASSYGAAGSLIIILLWVYYSTQILFLGAEFTQVYANRYGSHIKADDDAILLTEQDRVQQGMARPETVAQQAAQQGTTTATAVTTTHAPPLVTRAMPPLMGTPPPALQTAVNRFHSGLITTLAVLRMAWPKKLSE